MCKRGELGGLDMIGMIYRVAVVAVVALGVLGLFSISYEYYVDIRDAEAVILTREVSGCLIRDGVLDLGELKEHRKDVLGFCGYGRDDRLYVGVDVYGESGEKLMSLSGGNSAALWVRDLFGKVEELRGRGTVADNIDNIVKYNPGYYFVEYNVMVKVEDGLEVGRVEMEVLIKADE